MASILGILATAATYLPAHGLVPEYGPIFRRLVSCAAIIAATPVAFNILRVRDALMRQDVFLDMTDHPIIGRNARGIITYWNGAMAGALAKHAAKISPSFYRQHFHARHPKYRMR